MKVLHVLRQRVASFGALMGSTRGGALPLSWRLAPLFFSYHLRYR